MTAPEFPYKVGDKVRRDEWEEPESHRIITAIGVDRFLATSDLANGEMTYFKDDDWQPYTPPPERTRWTVTTERRVPKVNDSFVTNGRFYRLRETDDLASFTTDEYDVVVSVERAE